MSSFVQTDEKANRAILYILGLKVCVFCFINCLKFDKIKVLQLTLKLQTLSWLHPFYRIAYSLPS